MSNPKSIIDTEDFTPIFKFIGKNWYLFIIIPLLLYGFAYVYTYRLPNIYAAKTELLLRSSETYDYQSSINSNFGYYSIVQDIINQKRVLKSYDLLDKTLMNLNFNIDYFLIGGVREDEVLGFNYINLNIEPEKVPSSYTRISYIVEILDEKRFLLKYSEHGKDVVQELLFGKKYESPFKFSIESKDILIAGNVKKAKEFQYKFQIFHRKDLVGRYNRNLRVLNEEYTSILTLKLSDKLNYRAKLFLDTLCKVYTDYTVESQIKINENTTRYIDIQLNELKLTLDSLQMEVQLYREDKNIFDLTREQNELFNKLTNYEIQKQRLALRQISLKAVFNYTIKGINEINLPPIIDQNSDAILSEQINSLYQLKLKRAEMLTFFTPENSAIIKQDTLILVVINGIRNYLNSTSEVIKNNSKQIDSDINNTIIKLRNIPKSQQGIASIQRKLSVNEGIYQFLLKKKASTVIARAAIIPQVSIIESARSLGVIGPDRKRFQVIAAGIGLVLALIIGFVRLLFFERIENLKDFKSSTKLPVLGGIPHYADILENPLTITKNSRSNVSESFRSIRANLQYLLKSESKVKKLLTSSLHPSEGKTFMSTNLSSFLASSNKKVVLIDFDMHKPKVHKSLGLKNKQGLSSILIGKGEIADVINRDVVKNMDVITAGPIPPNASDLIINDRVDFLIRELEKEYDYIIFDTPPLMLISDSLVLMKYVDMGIFVFNTKKTTKDGIHYLEDVLEQNNLKNIALTLNNIEQKKWSYYKGKYYSYRYSYKYGYGYGNNEGYGSDYVDDEE